VAMGVAANFGAVLEITYEQLYWSGCPVRQNFFEWLLGATI
jgi:hypothetical protein